MKILGGKFEGISFNLPALNGKSNEAGYFDHRVCIIVKDVEHHNHVLEHIEENSPETDDRFKKKGVQLSLST